ncbi:MAG: signal peptidase II [Methylococcales bacterium]|nr:signal peptidase II [Methylococcales bacterium]
MPKFVTGLDCAWHQAKGGLMIALMVLVFDQLSKQWVVHNFDLYQSIPVMPFFNLTYLRNTGAAFSLLSEAGGWQKWLFSGLAIGVSIGLVIYLARLPVQQRLLRWSIALVLGGAVGNLIDRLCYGYVIDFLDVYYRTWHWPAFNIADSAISVGVFLMFVDSFRK